jgi:hypothetical protein
MKMAQQGPDDEVREPENSTVDDWFGQNVARDQEVADEAVAATGSDAEAKERFDEEADGEQRYQEGHQRPEGKEADGDAVGRTP